MICATYACILCASVLAPFWPECTCGQCPALPFTGYLGAVLHLLWVLGLSSMLATTSAQIIGDSC
jgi:hypothetical protein